MIGTIPIPMLPKTILENREQTLTAQILNTILLVLGTFIT